MLEPSVDQRTERAADRLLAAFVSLTRPWLIRVLGDSLGGAEGSGSAGSLDDAAEMERAAAEWADRYQARQRRSQRPRRTAARGGRDLAP